MSDPTSPDVIRSVAPAPRSGWRPRRPRQAPSGRHTNRGSRTSIGMTSAPAAALWAGSTTSSTW